VAAVTAATIAAVVFVASDEVDNDIDVHTKKSNCSLHLQVAWLCPHMCNCFPF
jgi:hypothetical protein